MDFDTALIQTRRKDMIEKGFWHDNTINNYLDAVVASNPDKLALSAFSVESGDTINFTYSELVQMADRVAVGLAKLGISKYDVVACQLPNWWQFTVMYLACSRIGAVINPLMHIFRERELSFMLAHGEAKAIVVPKKFRNFDYEKMLAGISGDLPHLKHVIVVGGEGDNSFETLLSGPQWENDAEADQILKRSRPGPDDPTQLIYTSGTTGEPKGAVHTANTAFANIIPFQERLRLGKDDVILMASPMAHQTGFLFGMILPVFIKARVVILDVWEPARAVQLIFEHKCTFTMASTPFLADLTGEVETSETDVSSLRAFLCAGAPIPGPLVERARKGLGAKIVSAWGMTENGAVTTTLLDDPDERSINTDGLPLAGVEIRIVDTAGDPVNPDVEGRLQIRASSNFTGYLKRAHLNGVDEEGWFETGDMARIDQLGYVRICGRSKDIIIRGGENIPVVEIEALLFGHPAVDMVAIVGYPDERLGERACAYITLAPGQSVTFEELLSFLDDQKVAKQYLPERLKIVDAMPTTASGKIQKFTLREMAKKGAGD